MKYSTQLIKKLSVLIIFCAALFSAFFATYTYADVFVWTARSSVPDPSNWTSVAMAATSPYVYAAHGSELFRSSDSGVSWSQVNSVPQGESITDISTSANGSVVSLTTTGGAYLDTGNYGAYLSFMHSGEGGFTTTSVSQDGFSAVYGSIDAVHIDTNYGGSTFPASGFTEWGIYDSAISNNSAYFYAIGISNRCLYASVDGGFNYAIVSCSNQYNHVATNADGSYVLLSDVSGNLFVSSDHGSSVSTRLSGTTWTSLSVSGSGSVMVAVSSVGGVYVSNDFGNTWFEEVTAPQTSRWNSVSLSSDGYTVVGVSSDAYIYTGTYDTLAPNVGNITSAIADGVYTVGQEIPINVNLDKPAFHNSTLTLTLETGATDRTCDVTFNNSNTGICTYTVQAGDTTSDLSVSNISGTLKNQNSYNRTSGFNNLATLASNKAIAIDTTSPAVMLTTPSTGSSLNGIVSLSATSSDANLIGVQFKYNSINIGTEDISYPYTVEWDTTGISNGSYTLSAVARDTAGNVATSSVIVTINNTSSNPLTQTAADAPVRGGSSVSTINQDNSSRIYLDQVISPQNTSKDVKTEASLRLEAKGIPHNLKFEKDLSINSTDDDVKSLQKILNVMGYTVATDGTGSTGQETTHFGTRTKDALIRFQTSYDIHPPQGFFGSITRSILNKILSILGY